MLTEVRSEFGVDKGYFNCFEGYGVLKNLWDDASLIEVANSFPPDTSPLWEEVCSRNERGARIINPRSLSGALDDLIDGLSSRRFVGMLEELTDIDDLVCDTDNITMQLLINDDYVGLHSCNPLSSVGWRRVRAQVFLSPVDFWGGDLKLYRNPEPFSESGMGLPKEGTCLLSAAPEFNHTVVFTTPNDHFYGQPLRVWGGDPCRSIVAHYCTKAPSDSGVFASDKTWWRT